MRYSATLMTPSLHSILTIIPEKAEHCFVDRMTTPSLPRVFVVDGGNRHDTMSWHVMDSLRHLGCAAKSFDVRTLIPGWIVGDSAVRKVAQVFLREPNRLKERTLLREIAEFAPDIVLVLIAKE